MSAVRRCFWSSKWGKRSAPLTALLSARVKLGFIRVLSSAVVTEPCHTSHRRRHFQNKRSVLFVNNIKLIYFHLKQNLSRTFVASCSVVPMDWVPALRCKHPFSCSAWRNALIGRCWEPAKCCLFTQLHQSKQTNKQTQANQTMWRPKKDPSTMFLFKLYHRIHVWFFEGLQYDYVLTCITVYLTACLFDLLFLFHWLLVDCFILSTVGVWCQ